MEIASFKLNIGSPKFEDFDTSECTPEEIEFFKNSFYNTTTSEATTKSFTSLYEELLAKYGNETEEERVNEFFRLPDDVAVDVADGLEINSVIIDPVPTNYDFPLEVAADRQKIGVLSKNQENEVHAYVQEIPKEIYPKLEKLSNVSELKQSSATFMKYFNNSGEINGDVERQIYAPAMETGSFVNAHTVLQTIKNRNELATLLYTARDYGDENFSVTLIAPAFLAPYKDQFVVQVSYEAGDLPRVTQFIGEVLYTSAFLSYETLESVSMATGFSFKVQDYTPSSRKRYSSCAPLIMITFFIGTPGNRFEAKYDVMTRYGLDADFYKCFNPYAHIIEHPPGIVTEFETRGMPSAYDSRFGGKGVVVRFKVGEKPESFVLYRKTGVELTHHSKYMICVYTPRQFYANLAKFPKFKEYIENPLYLLPIHRSKDNDSISEQRLANAYIVFVMAVFNKQVDCADINSLRASMQCCPLPCFEIKSMSEALQSRFWEQTAPECTLISTQFSGGAWFWYHFWNLAEYRVHIGDEIEMSYYHHKLHWRNLKKTDNPNKKWNYVEFVNKDGSVDRSYLLGPFDSRSKELKLNFDSSKVNSLKYYWFKFLMRAERYSPDYGIDEKRLREHFNTAMIWPMTGNWGHRFEDSLMECISFGVIWKIMHKKKDEKVFDIVTKYINDISGFLYTKVYSPIGPKGEVMQHRDNPSFWTEMLYFKCFDGALDLRKVALMKEVHLLKDDEKLLSDLKEAVFKESGLQYVFFKQGAKTERIPPSFLKHFGMIDDTASSTLGSIYIHPKILQFDEGPVQFKALNSLEFMID
jgi:hypothetical protein